MPSVALAQNLRGIMSIQLLVADHQELLRAGIKSLTARSSIEVVQEAEDDRQLMRQLKKSRPDVVLLSPWLPEEDGLAALAKVRKKYADLPVVMWGPADNPTYAARSMALGAQGYVSQGAGRKELLKCLGDAAQGSAWSKDQLRQCTGAADLPEGLGVNLTPREMEMIRQVGFGLSNKEIALAMGIGYETVKEHVQHILRKLNMTDRTQAAVWAIKQEVA